MDESNSDSTMQTSGGGSSGRGSDGSSSQPQSYCWAAHITGAAVTIYALRTLTTLAPKAWDLLADPVRHDWKPAAAWLIAFVVVVVPTSAKDITSVLRRFLPGGGGKE